MDDHQQTAAIMNDAMNDPAASEAGMKGAEGIDALARAVFAKLLIAARDTGTMLGREVAYRDILDELGTALATAEDELTRSPMSDLVMGEIMALRKLVAHFEPAPAYFAHEGEERAARLKDYCERIGVSGELRAKV